ncbi:MAG: DMT family transporter [Vicinamibacterales bacterium]|nr:DMT family transporter [Vicinamibacterales bacterium]
MRLYLYIFSMFLGVVLTVHLSMNGKVGVVLNNARVGNMLFWCIGAAMAILIGLSGWQAGALNGLKQVNPILLTAGAMGASLVFAIAWLIPQIGAGPFTLTLLMGQIISAMFLSHFGLLGSPVQPVSLKGIVGALIMVGGVVLATF